MRIRLYALAAMVFASLSLFAQSPAPNGASGGTGGTGLKPDPIHWQPGPMVAKLGTVAEITVPKGYLFADGSEARRLLEKTGNPPSGDELGVMTPASEAAADNWLVYFEFSETGYVKDTDGNKIDAPKLFESMQKGSEEENEERKKRGWIPFHLLSWQTQPFYDKQTNNLTWATLGYADDEKKSQTVNYSVRILGRRGVMRTDLVLDPSQEAAIPQFNELMKGYSFTTGSRYADFVKGDKVAEYGLTALIAGGATAVALKTGLFAKLLAMLAGLWKLIAVAFAALITRIKNIWAVITGKKKAAKEEVPPPPPASVPAVEPVADPLHHDDPPPSEPQV